MATTIFEKPMGTDLYNKVNISDIANNLTTDTAGKVLDARQGKALAEQTANIKTPNMFLKLTETYTTSGTGNANITQLSADNVIIAIRPPVGIACGFVGRGGNGAYYAHIVDSSNIPIVNTSVTLDIYYV